MTVLVDESVLEKASRLVCAVHDADPFESRDVLIGMGMDEVIRLAVVLAAHVDPDVAFVPTVRESTAMTVAEIASHAADEFKVSVFDVYKSPTGELRDCDATMVTCWVASTMHLPHGEIAAALRIHVFSVGNSVDTVTKDRRLIAAAARICAAIDGDE